jgi:hypothetical protein
MDEDTVLEQLEELARGFGIEVRYEPISFKEEMINTAGGLCILRGENLLVINSKAAVRDKIKVFVQALSHFDLDHIYIKPAIRELLETSSTCRTNPREKGLNTSGLPISQEEPSLGGCDDEKN